MTHRRQPLTFACGDYDINHAIATGEVRPRGIDLTVLTLPSPERHARMALHAEFDACELSMATLLAMRGAGDHRFVAIPAFPHRRFRHGFIFVGERSGIADPADLAGRRIGLRTWQTTAGLWARGILQDEHGVDLTSIRWVTQDAEDIPLAHADRFEIARVEPGRSVVDELVNGNLDALVYPEAPTPGTGVRRLFEDPKREEIAYFERTGIFPIMHTVVIRREILERLPWVARELLDALRESKRRAFDRMRDPRRVSLAWWREALDEQRSILGPDPWPYDLAANRAALDTLVRYAHEQGLLAEPIAPEELFAPSTVDELPAYV